MLKNLFHIGGNAAKEKYQKQISCLEILLYDFYLNLSLVSLLDFVKKQKKTKMVTSCIPSITYM